MKTVFALSLLCYTAPEYRRIHHRKEESHIIKDEYTQLLHKAKIRHPEILKRMRYLSKLTKPGFDAKIHAWHDEVFLRIDCTECGNCCRNYGPRFRETDIKHMCKASGRDPKEFVRNYLEKDPDGTGYVLRELPCPFQNPDNTCSDYEVRTLSCREFPHTESRNIQKKLVGLALDSLYCPAAYLICEKIMAEY